MFRRLLEQAVATGPVRFGDVRFGYWPKPSLPSPTVPRPTVPGEAPFPDPVRTVVVCSTNRRRDNLLARLHSDRRFQAIGHAGTLDQVPSQLGSPNPELVIIDWDNEKPCMQDVGRRSRVAVTALLVSLLCTWLRLLHDSADGRQGDP